MRHDLKYLIAYLLPASALLAVVQGGFYAPATVYLAFVLLPVSEGLLLPKSTWNHPPESEASRLSLRFFDVLLYLNVPLLYGILGLFFYNLSIGSYDSGWEIAGIVLSCGILAGTTGINVAHELGHRHTPFERFLAKSLLLPSLYVHFIIEHNLGHHKHVATDADPASARLNETVYAFWLRSTVGSYASAWRIENALAKRSARPFWRHRMVQATALQFCYLGGIALLFGPLATLCAVLVAVGGFLNLETVNYIEHYGLRRTQLASGRYEPVRPRHSWNSNHEVGRIFLYELTRHSDHHFKATRKYQVLRHFEESPQLLFGYPGSMLLALVPPLWFRVMNRRLGNYWEAMGVQHPVSGGVPEVRTSASTQKFEV